MDAYQPSPALEAHKHDEHHGSHFSNYIHDVVYGGIDGIVTTFAVVSGSAGAEFSSAVVIILGLANLFADGLSMGIGNFLSLRSERDTFKRLRSEEKKEIQEMPEIEREEIREIYFAKGFRDSELDMIVERITSDPEIWINEMMKEEHGLCPDDNSHPAVHSAMTFIAFVIFGSIPVMPYLFQISSAARFPVAILSTLLAMLLLGLLRARIIRRRYFWGTVELVGLGVVSAGVAYGVGAFLGGFVS